MLKPIPTIATLMLAAAITTGCGGGGSQNQSSEDSQQQERPDQQSSRPDMSGGDSESDSEDQYASNDNMVDLTDADGTASVTIETPGDNMQNMRYSINNIKVKKGQEVEVTLSNVAPESASAMQHNFVVVDPDNARSVAQAGMKNKKNNYLPEDQRNILANTKLLKPGQETTITFTMDETGTYEFICTYPGHYPTMKGQIEVVEPSAS